MYRKVDLEKEEVSRIEEQITPKSQTTKESVSPSSQLRKSSKRYHELTERTC